MRKFDLKDTVRVKPLRRGFLKRNGNSAIDDTNSYFIWNEQWRRKKDRHENLLEFASCMLFHGTKTQAWCSCPEDDSDTFDLPLREYSMRYALRNSGRGNRLGSRASSSVNVWRPVSSSVVDMSVAGNPRITSEQYQCGSVSRKERDDTRG